MAAFGLRPYLEQEAELQAEQGRQPAEQEVPVRVAQQLAPIAGRALGLQQAGVQRAQASLRGAHPGVIQPVQQFRQAGASLLPGLAEGAARGPVTQAELMQTPGVQFRLGEAQKALERGAAARGTLLSGGHQRELGRYMQNLASQEYGAAEDQRLRRLQRMQGVAGLGLQAAGAEMGVRERFSAAQAGLEQELAAAQAARTLTPSEIRAQGQLAAYSAGQARLQPQQEAGPSPFAQALGTGGGAILGGIYGGPAGAQVGASVGSALGGLF